MISTVTMINPVYIIIRSVSLATAVAALTLNAHSQGNTSSNNPPALSEKERLEMRQDMYFTTPEIKLLTLQVMINEANLVAQRLKMREPMPITKSSVVDGMINPPWFAMRDSFGRISTTNYVYFFTVQKKFAGFAPADWSKVYSWLKSESVHKEPDTNAAFMEACQLMRSVSFDVDALNKDCTAVKYVDTPSEIKGRGFFCIVNWRQGDHTVADIQFLEPGPIVLEMHMYTNRYINRKPMEIPNLEKLLRGGNAPKLLLRGMGFEKTDEVSTNSP